ncbi:Palmitoyltransferase zdhhc14 [Linnemannia zychae]|nr:Palmitoyltransferase zdhhc14 [Linnemannia zychae]
MPTVDPAQVHWLDTDTDSCDNFNSQQPSTMNVTTANATIPFGQQIHPENEPQGSPVTFPHTLPALNSQGSQTSFSTPVAISNTISITSTDPAASSIQVSNEAHNTIPSFTSTQASSFQSILNGRTLLEPGSEPYPSFQSFFSLPSSSAERGMSFEQMLMANSAIASASIGNQSGIQESPTLESTSPIVQTSTRTAVDSDNGKRFPETASHPLSSDTSEESEKTIVDNNNSPISLSTSTHIGSPNSDPSSIDTILSVAGYIPGTSREEMEEECLDYRLKGRSRVSRGYSADFSTNQWSVAAGGNHASTAQDHPRVESQHNNSSSQPPSRTSTHSIRSPSSVRARPSKAAEMVQLTDFLAEDPKMSSPTNSSLENRYLSGPHPGFPQYNSPSTPPQPALSIPNQSGRIPITSASGQFSGFQQYTPNREAKQNGHSRISSIEHPLPTNSSPRNDIQLPNADSGVLGTENDHGEDEFLNQGKPVRNYKIFPGRNLFFCGGRIMTSRDFPAFLVAVLLLTMPTGLFHGFTSPFLWHHVSPAAPIVQAYLFIVTFSSMLKTSWTDPGVIPRGIDGDPPLDPPRELDSTTASFYPPQGLPRMKEVQVGMYTVRLKYCETCKIYRPPRCSHCRQCDNCVEDEDHHCIWLNNCIGRRNYRYFLIFVTTASIYAFYTSALCLTHLLLLYHEKKSDPSEKPSFQRDALAKAPVSALVMIFAFVMGLAVGALATYHFWLATVNRTTHEQWSASMMRPHVVDNPFDRGNIFANCAAVLCRPPTRSYIRRRDYTVT